MKKVFILAMFTWLTSCSEKLLQKPEDLIARDKMVELLKDLAIVNAAKTTNATKLRDNNIDPMAYILAKYNIDSIQFVESDRYYASLPVQYESMYKEVESRLEKEQQVLNDAKKLKDSLKQLETERKRKIELVKRQGTTDSLGQTSGNKKQ